MLERLTTFQRQYLAQRVKPFMFQKEYSINSNKITYFIEFYNLNKYPQFCKNYIEELHEGIFLLISL
jgi:hypothetical protein